MTRTAPRILARAALLLGAGLALGGCDNACDFLQRCRGNVLQICGHVDQVFHRRIREEECLAPNGACVERGASAASCVRAPPEPCDEGFRARCEGTLRLYCAPGGPQQFVVAEDCAGARSADGKVGRCVAEPQAGAVCAF